MSKTVMLIRRKSDNKLLTDIINDVCQVHNIYDGENLILSDKEWMIGYSEDKGFDESSEYEQVDKDIVDTVIEGQLHCYEFDMMQIMTRSLTNVKLIVLTKIKFVTLKVVNYDYSREEFVILLKIEERMFVLDVKMLAVHG